MKRASLKSKSATAPKKATVKPLPRFEPSPFWLKGDVEAPAAPCTVEALLAKLAASLKNVASPDITGMPTDAEEDRDIVRLVYASAAMIEIWRWIFDHAINGNLAAQDMVFADAATITSDFVECARRQLPAIKNNARKSIEMPGMVSTDRHLMDEMRTLCQSLEQGQDHPFPLEHAQGRKQKAKITTAQHLLVNHLWSYMDKHRQQGGLGMAQILERQKARGAFVHPLYESMIDLPPLAPETWKQWRDLGFIVIEGHTGGNPLNHPSFQKGGIYSALGGRDSRKEPVWKKRLAEAWKLIASGMA
jgi:hypothetical protein